MKSLLLLILLLLTASVHSLSPIIIIPGLVGSQLVADLDKSTGPWLCRKHRDSYHLWFNIRLSIQPGYDTCFVEYVKLFYDKTTKQYHDNKGVQVLVPGFGETDTVEYLTNHIGFVGIPYFHKFVRHFERMGYTKGKNLNAAPYDWRLAPDGLTRNGYKALYQLIEDTYTRNGNTPVTLVGHSMGGPVTTYFLSKYVQSAEWKASRIKQFISLSGAFGGSAIPVPTLVSGLEIKPYLYFMRPLVMREAMRSFPSLVYLLPSPKLWSSEEALVTLPNKTYTAHDYETLFADMNYENGSRILSEVQGLTSDFPAPNVTHYCFYGANVSTISGMIYKSRQFPDDQTLMSYGDGDGVVNARSLDSCLLWKDKQELPVVTRSFPKVNHITIVMDNSVLSAVEDILQD